MYRTEFVCYCVNILSAFAANTKLLLLLLLGRRRMMIDRDGEMSFLLLRCFSFFLFRSEKTPNQNRMNDVDGGGKTERGRMGRRERRKKKHMGSRF